MKPGILISILLLLAASCFSGCGKSGGGGSSVQPAPATVVLTTSKTKAMANGNDAIAIRAEVKEANGAAVPDGVVVAFSLANGAGTLSAASAAVQNGIATVNLTSSNAETITVIGMNSGVAGASTVKFIGQPATAEVSISLNQAVTNLAALSFKLNSDPGVSFDNAGQPISAVNTASGSLVAGNFTAATNSNIIALINGGTNGFNTGTVSIIKATVEIGAVSALPELSIDSAPETFTAVNAAGGPAAPAVTSANLIVSVIYNTE